MKNRRVFLKQTAIAAAATILPNTGFSQNTEIKTLKAKRLKKGDTIGIIAPGYGLSKDTLESVFKTVRSMGFVPYYTNRLYKNHGYFSNTDKERAADLNEMFANPKVDGILCARGGYGCTRILQFMDFDAIKNNPKVFIGFSDVTALLNPIYQQTGLVGFHGPVGTTLINTFSQKWLKKLVMKNKTPFKLRNTTSKSAEENINPEFEQYCIYPGKAGGVLIGGSLTLITALLGTPYEIDFTNKLIFIEEIEEAPYRIDRMLTQLLGSNTFSNAAGIILGIFKGCDRPKDKTNFTLKEVLVDRLSPLKIPVAYGFSFGHVSQNLTIPTGIKASFNAEKISLALQENTVI
ncbi:S66 peptidase family protein [Croceivirga radicis]|uniref:S66 peptidase family protein n=1 Tax=Croceivirga radicis TaxID=1929488 RepID=UPI000255B598|nr:LD-carboxypeptidase [Croceivirga radicis]